MSYKSKLLRISLLTAVLVFMACLTGCNDYSPDGVVRTAGWALKNGNLSVFRNCFTGQKLEQLEEFGMRDYIVLHQQDIDLHSWSVGPALRIAGPRNDAFGARRFSVNVTDDRTHEFLFTAFVRCEFVRYQRQRLSGRYTAAYDGCRIYDFHWGQ